MTEPILVDAAAAAHAAQVQVATLRQWVRRGHISAPDRYGRYDLREIYAYQRGGSSGRHAQAVAARSRRGEKRRKGIASDGG